MPTSSLDDVLHVDLLVAFHLMYTLVNGKKHLGQESQTHPVLFQKCDVLLRELATGLIVVDALSTIATLELVTDNTSFHGSHPGFSDVCVTSSQPH